MQDAGTDQQKQLECMHMRAWEVSTSRLSGALIDSVAGFILNEYSLSVEGALGIVIAGRHRWQTFWRRRAKGEPTCAFKRYISAKESWDGAGFRDAACTINGERSRAAGRAAGCVSDGS